ncbi:hypothetical protein PAMC26577_20485 [Caballeronia sordidicola]|uniref:Uncharacterized protein n=1 Tax=Caballeronia sordidicola TaxID=196367 RepID=A0A242MN53_CABSO|nr:hypothetical protein PAMC26577_20485 [Caballeronia sordidicola]
MRFGLHGGRTRDGPLRLRASMGCVGVFRRAGRRVNPKSRRVLQARFDPGAACSGPSILAENGPVAPRSVRGPLKQNGLRNIAEPVFKTT